MSNYSLEWFVTELKSSMDQILKKAKTQQPEPEQVKGDDGRKPYISVKLVNNSLTVILEDGAILNKVPATPEDFARVREARTEADIVSIMISPEFAKKQKEIEDEKKRQDASIKAFEMLKGCEDFEVEGSSVYLKGLKRSLPPLLVEEFSRVIMENTGDLQGNEKYVSLKRFFMWCCLNPRAEVASELYDFLRKNSFRITKQGFFVALRNVVSLNESGGTRLVNFVSNAYNKVKAVWKKDPSDYVVFDTGDGYRLEHKDGNFFTYEERKNDNLSNYDDDDDDYYNDDDDEMEETHHMMGNLKDLYLDLPNLSENRFTDYWTKTFDIRIGKVVSMPPEECSWSKADCAEAGLHFTSDQIHYVGCGETSVLILINPMKVVGIGEHKGRCYEYLPIMTVPREEATTILHDLDFDTLELDDEFTVHELDGLEEKVQNGFATERKKFEYNIPQMTSAEVKTMILSLSQMKNEISRRVKQI